MKDSIERQMDKVEAGDKIFTGMFWETVSKPMFNRFRTQASADGTLVMGSNYGLDSYPTAFLCDGHMVERHAVLAVQKG